MNRKTKRFNTLLLKKQSAPFLCDIVISLMSCLLKQELVFKNDIKIGNHMSVAMTTSYYVFCSEIFGKTIEMWSNELKFYFLLIECETNGCMMCIRKKTFHESFSPSMLFMSTRQTNYVSYFLFHLPKMVITFNYLH